ncbi:TonB-dependent receptor plug domain-containing protein, partial [Escherichia coli]|uniref:TonB-dependent receptor plug domain-containing protein n=1 Tax=Escherichia coli TaxID=562 RepID=UPI0028DA66DA
MARSKTAQPKHSLRKIAVVVATAVSGMSVYAQAAVEPKEDTITVTAAPAPQESAWGPAATIAARQSATGTKTDTPIQKVPQSISVVTAEEMALHQPKSVKEALSYTPGVSVGTRGASNTYDHLIIRGFAAEGQSQNNGTVAKLAMRQPFVLFKGLTFQKLCLPGAFRPGDHHNKMLRPG